RSVRTGSIPSNPAATRAAFVSVSNCPPFTAEILIGEPDSLGPRMRSRAGCAAAEVALNDPIKAISTRAEYRSHTALDYAILITWLTAQIPNTSKRLSIPLAERQRT